MTSSKRQPSGIPIGGQFAAHQHAESEVCLADALAVASELEFDADMVLRASRSALSRRRRTSPTFAEEVVGETAYQVTKTVSNGVAGGAVVELSPRYVGTVARNVAAKMAMSETQSADRWAISEYHRLLAVAEQAEKRMLTPAEEDDLAESIRAQQTPKHRASRGFHRRNHMPVPLRRVDVVNIADPAAAGTDDFEAGSLGDRLLVDLDAGVRRSDAALRAWDALAERSCAPRVRAGSMSSKRRDSSLETIRRAGGVAAVTKRYLEGTGGKVAANQADRLFEPFDAPTPEDRRAVARVLLGAGEYGDSLWRAAAKAVADGGPPT